MTREQAKAVIKCMTQGWIHAPHPDGIRSAVQNKVRMVREDRVVYIRNDGECNEYSRMHYDT